MKLMNHFLSGQTDSGEPERAGDVYDPATGEISAAVGFASSDIVEMAVRPQPPALTSPRNSHMLFWLSRSRGGLTCVGHTAGSLAAAVPLP